MEEPRLTKPGMRKVISFRRGRNAPMATVESCIAHLHEELNLTTAFTGAMVRMGNYRAALGVVEEQRERVRQIPAHFDRAFARPRRKAKAAVAGLAAAALIGSGALAAWVAPNRSEAAQTVARMEKVVEAVNAANSARSPAVRDAYVGVATSALAGLDLRSLPPNNTIDTTELRDALRLLQSMDGVRGDVMRTVAEYAKKAGVRLPKTVEPPPAPQPKPGPESPAPISAE